MRTAAVTLACVLAGGGCKLYFGDGDDEAAPDAFTSADAQSAVDAGFTNTCLEPGERANDCVVDVSGTVVDFASGDPVTGMPVVETTTAWDTIPPFPAGCTVLGSVTADGTGAFAIPDATCDSPLYPPVFLVMVSGGTDARAATATDARLTCPAAPDCGALTVEVRAPSVADAAAWRDRLAEDGTANALERGLVVFEFREPTGDPAAGVVPIVREGTTDRVLAPGSEVRFLANDRRTLVRADAATTGTSGLALIAYDGFSAFVGGRRTMGSGAMQTWQPVGVLFSAGWIFLEDRTRDP